jgi:hypothetical protein
MTGDFRGSRAFGNLNLMFNLIPKACTLCVSPFSLAVYRALVQDFRTLIVIDRRSRILSESYAVDDLILEV